MKTAVPSLPSHRRSSPRAPAPPAPRARPPPPHSCPQHTPPGATRPQRAQPPAPLLRCRLRSQQLAPHTQRQWLRRRGLTWLQQPRSRPPLPAPRRLPALRGASGRARGAPDPGCMLPRPSRTRCPTLASPLPPAAPPRPQPTPPLRRGRLRRGAGAAGARRSPRRPVRAAARGRGGPAGVCQSGRWGGERKEEDSGRG